ncbi:protein GrpE-like isoform X2 [Vespula squamosa]|uniref:Protein GrpE-like isoform X2 n=1 Tax=Vespula squamosa TaxID=30214 RepID=A0ABD2A663_VESSQ
MSMFKGRNTDTEVLIEETLEDIWNITLKIKKELDIINDLVRDNGDFNAAVKGTNQSLLKIVDKKGIDLSVIEEEEREDGNINNTTSKSGSDIVDPIVPVINKFAKILKNNE